MKSLLFLKSYILKYRKRFFTGIAFVLMTNAVSMAAPRLLGYIIDSLGWVYYQKGLYDEALTSLEKAASLTPDDPTIAEHLGDVYFKKMRYREALEMYRKSLSLNHPQRERVEKKLKEVEELLQ